ncbi:hypothetical protein FA09DRAFT_7147 [Tilletiopsis washingtonensis]|uniref:Uncharacterized protein n=1 Tax=Tilletiopsis washingtonensis TaxID=58919 RepID=A0A316ZHI9_9BASI|nr:hypothetical protein FA09DRAFT_7147 [Tilletiopsis washingtonensis]PWO01238.1 hypothetical protein FA09DRAFT_7147 [Tilletiopsis washingtonensis]
MPCWVLDAVAAARACHVAPRAAASQARDRLAATHGAATDRQAAARAGTARGSTQHPRTPVGPAKGGCAQSGCLHLPQPHFMALPTRRSRACAGSGSGRRAGGALGSDEHACTHAWARWRGAWRSAAPALQLALRSGVAHLQHEPVGPSVQQRGVGSALLRLRLGVASGRWPEFLQPQRRPLRRAQHQGTPQAAHAEPAAWLALHRRARRAPNAAQRHVARAAVRRASRSVQCVARFLWEQRRRPGPERPPELLHQADSCHRAQQTFPRRLRSSSQRIPRGAVLLDGPRLELARSPRPAPRTVGKTHGQAPAHTAVGTPIEPRAVRICEGCLCGSTAASSAPVSCASGHRDRSSKVVLP